MAPPVPYICLHLFVKALSLGSTNQLALTANVVGVNGVTLR